MSTQAGKILAFPVRPRPGIVDQLRWSFILGWLGGLCVSLAFWYGLIRILIWIFSK